MRTIKYYKLNGQVKMEELLTKENLEHINGMMTKCTMVNGTEEVGLAYLTDTCYIGIYDDKINECIYLLTLENLDENTGNLIGNDDEKYNQIVKTVKIDDIEKVESILYSNSRWDGKLTNKFEVYKNNYNEKELEISKSLINKSKEDINEDISTEEKTYYYLTVRYEDYYSEKEYNYISDDLSIKVGDRVIVDMAGETVIAEVLKTEYCDEFDVPFPVHITKKIIKKVDESFDIADIEFYKELDNKKINIIRMNLDDTYFEFGVFNYVKGKDNDNSWTDIRLRVNNSNFKYFVVSELMTFAEIEKMLKAMKKILKDELEEKEEIGFYEPDLEFILYPKINLLDTGKYTYIKEGNEIQDIYMELIINLKNRSGIYTGQKYVMIFNREEIEKITKYLEGIIN